MFGGGGWLKGSDSVGITSIPIGNCVFVDAVNGSNLTGIRGRLDKPFATPNTAVTAALAGDTVIIWPNLSGVPYTSAGNLMKVGVNIYGINRPAINGTSSHLFVDTGGAYTGRIEGLGDLTCSSGSVLRTTNAGSD